MLRGVIFYIEAETLEEAKGKAARGEYREYDAKEAEEADWEIRQRSILPNI